MLQIFYLAQLHAWAFFTANICQRVDTRYEVRSRLIFMRDWEVFIATLLKIKYANKSRCKGNIFFSWEMAKTHHFSHLARKMDFWYVCRNDVLTFGYITVTKTLTIWAACGYFAGIKWSSEPQISIKSARLVIFHEMKNFLRPPLEHITKFTTSLIPNSTLT